MTDLTEETLLLRHAGQYVTFKKDSLNLHLIPTEITAEI